MKYIENPKTKGSGILGAIPQKGTCPNNCEDCFFQSGRSYLEPLDENTPNLPDVLDTVNRVIRVNDGNDSNFQREKVIEASQNYSMKFYNTSVHEDLDKFDAPVVLTVNPGKMTDVDANLLIDPPKNLMFVRVRTNTWNRPVVDAVISHYSNLRVPIVLTFMAYHDEESIPDDSKGSYRYRKRTLNSYWAINTISWEIVMSRYKHNKWVHSCGKIEGEKGDTHCRFCGNCIREFYATMERLR
jgi:hypothetical protein